MIHTRTGRFYRPVDSCALAARNGGLSRSSPVGDVGGVKRLGLVEDLASNLGRFVSEKSSPGVFLQRGLAQDTCAGGKKLRGW